MKCPRCGKETDYTKNPFRPFCSERCKIIDLGNWISGAYHIASENPSKEENGTAIPQKDSDKE